MKQQKLSEIRDYRKSPRAAHEDPDPNYRSDLEFTEEDYLNSPTKQSDAEAADINNIMKKYEQTGFVPHNDRVPQYGDFSNVHDFRAAMDIVAGANSLFAGLPAKVRAEFNNDPAEFLEFTDRRDADPKVMTRLVELGLAEVQDLETPAKTLKDIRTELEKANKAKQKPASGASKDE